MSMNRHVAVVAASGASFTAEQALAIEAARARNQVRVIAVNDNWRLLPHADVLYACDGMWWDKHLEAVLESKFDGQLWTQHRGAADKHALCFVECETKLPGLGKRREDGRMVLHSGGNSGYQAINLAYYFGALTIILVGFDAKRTGGKAHWFGEHARGLSRTHPYSTWLKAYPALARDLRDEGITVLNCSGESDIDCFDRADLLVTLETLDHELGSERDARTGRQPAPACGSEAVAGER